MKKMTISCLALLCFFLSHCQEEDWEAKLPIDCVTSDCQDTDPSNYCQVSPLPMTGSRYKLSIDREKFSMYQFWGSGFSQLSSFAYSTLFHPVYRDNNRVIAISTPIGELRFKALSSATISYSPYVSNPTYRGTALRNVEGTFRGHDGRIRKLRSVFDSPTYQYKIDRASIYTSPPGWTMILEEITCENYPTNRLLIAVSVPISLLIY